MGFKLFDLDVSNEEHSGSDVVLSLSEVLAMEEHRAEVDRDILSLEEMIIGCDEAETIVVSLGNDLLSLESGEVGLKDLNAINSRYIAACTTTGCVPMSLSNEDGAACVEVSTEGVSEVITKMKEAIKVIIAKIVIFMKKMYAKVLIAFGNDEKKAGALIVEFRNYFIKNPDMEPTKGNWRLTDSARNALYNDLAAFYRFKSKNATFYSEYDEFAEANASGGLVLESDFKTIDDISLYRTHNFAKATPNTRLDKSINDDITTPFETFEDQDHYITSYNGKSFGALTMIYEKGTYTVIDLKYSKRTLKGLVGGDTVKSKTLKDYAEFNIIPDFSLDTLTSLSITVHQAAKRIKDVYNEQTTATEDMKKMLEEETDASKIAVLKKVILLAQQIATDKILGFLQMNRAMLRLLSLQSYNFKK